MTIQVLPQLALPLVDRRLVPLVGVLVCGIAAGIALGWWVGAGFTLIGVYLAVRPLEPFRALLLVATVASFVNNEGGHLTRELSVVTALLFYGAFCVLLAHVAGRWALPRAPLTTAILLFELSTLVAAAHGILAGNELRYLGLELLPLLGLAMALMIGGLTLSAADLSFAFAVLNIASLGHVALGVANYQINGMRAGGIWFTPLPGLMALLLFNLALRCARRRDRWGLMLLIAANLIHQLISLTRGYWMGLAAGLALSTIVYVGRGPEARPRWRRVLGIGGGLAGFAVAGVTLIGAVFGWHHTGAMFGTRLASSVGTQQTSETASNFERVMEWVAAARRIAEAPFLGHGLGFTFHIHFPFVSQPSTQWFLHQLYLWMWVKQGLVGLALLVAVLATAMRMGMRNARRLEGMEAGWAAGAAAATAYIATLSLTNFPMAQVNSTLALATLWGIGLSVGRPDRWRLVWRVPEAGPTGVLTAGS